MTGFQRARSEEQRAARRQAILATAEAMVAAMPVAEISLNELARRVGLAKSNVLRYFESREAVLLDLLEQEQRRWLDELADALRTGVDPDAPAVVRVDQVAAAVVASLAGCPRFCELLSTAASVLERNVSAEVAVRFKTGSIANTARLAELVRTAMPELGEDASFKWAGAAQMGIGAMWTHSRPSPAMTAAYEADPALTVLRLDFAANLTELLAVLLAGLLARS
ncbi:TetR family transcriptional regulator [Pseudonocardia sp. CNS-139]|nr:TetR family transcriptional regulator [Pseudonocardia sp. CNS-139]